MDGNKGKIEVENKAKFNLKPTRIVTSQTKAEQNLGARPKILDKPPENNSTKSRSKLNSNSDKAGKSELELAFARMRSKKEEKLGPITLKSSKTPSKTSPTKLLSKVRRSPKNIMREIKHKIEGNRVKTLIRNLESCTTLGHSPKTPKSAKARALGALKGKDKKVTPSRRKASISADQPKIKLFFGPEKKS